MYYSEAAQDFLDGLQKADKQKCRDAYVHYFLETYKLVPKSKYAKNNALRQAVGLTDTDIVNLEN
tara:strand:+ start:1093 stop:1287 length:195 start_codon:yes stop_codon:yes gene_type:complete